ncbi:MAG: hypothetical protein LBK50_01075 [Candidatus Nomurabacteria bacterium]|jgi:hypothetical protein|nr:hypothetical protein [Candidatus Nomurabacteria bacterium]
MNYKIIYDIAGDMWNWWSAIHYSSKGVNWADNLTNPVDKKIAEQIKGLSQSESEKILRPYLSAQEQNSNSQLNNFIQIAEQDFANKFIEACRALEKITNHPMMSDEFTFVITTFPRSPYFYDDRRIFMYDSIEGKWGMPIDAFLHEGLHFQFIHYWRKNQNSPVSQLSEEEFDYLKESLTVILDEELYPLVKEIDTGYPQHRPFRKVLHAHWKKYHDFDKLVDYGVERLSEFVNTRVF